MTFKETSLEKRPLMSWMMHSRVEGWHWPIFSCRVVIVALSESLNYKTALDEWSPNQQEDDRLVYQFSKSPCYRFQFWSHYWELKMIVPGYSLGMFHLWDPKVYKDGAKNKRALNRFRWLNKCHLARANKQWGKCYTCAPVFHFDITAVHTGSWLGLLR